MCEYEANKKTPLEYLEEGYILPEICEKLGITKTNLLSRYRADLIAYVKRLIEQGKTAVEISNLTGISYDTVGKLKNEDELHWREISEEQKKEVFELSKAGLSPQSISSELDIPLHLVMGALKNSIILGFMKSSQEQVTKDFSIHKKTITKILKEEGFVIPKSGLAKKITEHYGDGTFPFDQPISRRLRDIIEGELLGDGNIARTGALVDKNTTVNYKEYEEALRNLKLIHEANKLEDIPNAIKKYNNSIQIIEKVKCTHFELHKAIKEIDWPHYIGKVLNEDGYKTKMTEYTDNCYCKSEASFQFQKLREEWYDEKRKILPEHFKLNADKLLGLYEGDGYFNKKLNRINLSTLNFTKEENTTIKDQINKEAGIESIVTRRLKNEKIYWEININKSKDVDKFFQYLEENANKESLDMAKKAVPQKFRD